MKSHFPKRFCAGILLFSMLPICGGSSLLAIEDLYNFPSISSKEKIEFERERKLCFFPLRNLSGDSALDFYSAGYASVLYSGLKTTVQIYDENALPASIQHPFGNQDSVKQEKVKEGEWDSDRLEKLRSGQLVVPIKNDPRYLSLRSEPFESEPAPDDGGVIPLARKNNCFYSVTGEFEKKSADEMRVRIVLRSFKDGAKKEFSHKTSVRRSYQELNPLIESLKSFLLGKFTFRLTVKSEGILSSLVFLDGNYIGKTPLVRNDILPGIHDVRVTREGFNDWRGEVDMRTSSREISVQMFKEKKEGFLSVTSDPPGANVYFGSELLGVTPLNKVPVKVGWNRIRLSKEGHVDILKGIEIKKDQTSEVAGTLKQGDSVSYYKNKKYVFLDHTYDDFAIYSLYGSLLFYAGYYYFNLKADSILEGSRPMTNALTVTGLATLIQNSSNFNSFATAYYYQYNIHSQAESKANYYRGLAGYIDRDTGVHGGLMLYGIAAMLAFSVSFYVLGLDSETLDVGVAPVRTPYFARGLEYQFETETYARFKHKF
ncbi:PEGA domain protein [Leptospira inadai serovar Lyme str. 10]|uniref:PEGA domain protein n=3 Tax=Leptospira inadai TaxID=29506 RepID=V6HE03_9LEPT|nr:PEGA domain-containing protein [Leptospira inadai]EQA37433.1 PEGA domain protein [Leptospira inadai serovar Lyme str. 10]PNV74988.1 PEGA domain-containing protein [Leptospira inadai serovar Lyme]